MGLIRGYIAFPGNMSGNTDKIRFEGIKTYSADGIEINGKEISAPAVLLDGSTTKDRIYFIHAAEQIMNSQGRSINDVATSNNMPGSNGKFILPLKGSQFDEGNYFSIKFRPDEMTDLTGVFEEASKIGGKPYVLDVLIREVGKTDSMTGNHALTGNSIYCLDVITRTDTFDFQDEARSILEKRLKDTGKNKKILNDLTRIYGLTRIQ